MNQFDDFDTSVQCEEYYTEEQELYDNYRRHSKQSHLSREALHKLSSRARRKAKEKARARKRMFRERLRSQQLETRAGEVREQEDSFGEGTHRDT